MIHHTLFRLLNHCEELYRFFKVIPFERGPNYVQKNMVKTVAFKKTLRSHKKIVNDIRRSTSEERGTRKLEDFICFYNDPHALHFFLALTTFLPRRVLMPGVNRQWNLVRLLLLIKISSSIRFRSIIAVWCQVSLW